MDLKKALDEGMDTIYYYKKDMKLSLKTDTSDEIFRKLWYTAFDTNSFGNHGKQK